MGLGLQGVESGDDGGDVAEMGGVVEAGVEIGQAEALGDLRIEGEEVAQGRALVSCAERRSLDDRVRRLAAHPAALDEGAEDAAAGVQAVAALDVLAHPLGADGLGDDDDVALDEPAEDNLGDGLAVRGADLG
jgi:hypothetical protein